MNDVIADVSRRPTPLSIFWHVAWRFALQGVSRGAVCGLGYGCVYAVATVPLGIGYGFLFGLLIGAGIGAAMGLIGGGILGAFSVHWSRSRNGVLSPEDTVNRDGYRRNINAIAIITTAFGSLVLFPTVFLLWLTDCFRGQSGYLFLDLVPSLIAGFAAYQAAEKIINWYEDHVREPNSAIVFPSEAPPDVWSPPPLRPEDL